MREETATSTRTRIVGTWTVTAVEELASARSRLQESLCAWTPVPWTETDSSRSLLQNIVLVASELTANALEHAGGPARLDVVSDDTAVTVSVMDRSPDNPPVLTFDRELGAGGFGLQLALRVADDVGWYRTPDGAKHVWARFVVLAPEPASLPGSPSDHIM
ncbi:ATP-binding protein [Isoptericola croceus]|uniref:ATP-binding protein n=1 Tax=Isoptericola croceus TaxID=3031406 RepID=UPI0023F827FD|nr:ATP-binding protein [Isoptericola croceus]